MFRDYLFKSVNLFNPGSTLGPRYSSLYRGMTNAVSRAIFENL